MPNLKNLIQKTVLALALTLPTGCSTSQLICFTDYVESSSGVIESNPLQILNDPDVIQTYKDYFPNNKPGVSYDLDTKRTKTRFSVNPEINAKDNKINYGILMGTKTDF